MYKERGQEELTHAENMEYHANDPTHFWSESQPLEGYGNLTHPWFQNDKLLNDCYYDLLCEEANKFHGALVTHDPYYLELHDMSYIYQLFDLCHELAYKWHVICSRMLYRVKRDYHLACFDIECLCALINESLFIPLVDDLSCFLESRRLAFEVDSFLSDLECSKFEIEDRKEVIVFYSINGDDVEYFPQTYFHAKVDFIFPIDSFLPLFKQPMIKETLMIHATLVAICLERLFMVSTWAKICLIAYSFACSCRRRTIGPLSQTFDTYD